MYLLVIKKQEHTINALKASLHSEYFYFWYFKYILLIIRLYVYLSNILNSGLVMEYF